MSFWIWANLLWPCSLYSVFSLSPYSGVMWWWGDMLLMTSQSVPLSSSDHTHLPTLTSENIWCKSSMLVMEYLYHSNVRFTNFDSRMVLKNNLKALESNENQVNFTWKLPLCGFCPKTAPFSPLACTVAAHIRIMLWACSLLLSGRNSRRKPWFYWGRLSKDVIWRHLSGWILTAIILEWRKPQSRVHQNLNIYS